MCADAQLKMKGPSRRLQQAQGDQEGVQAGRLRPRRAHSSSFRPRLGQAAPACSLYAAGGSRRPSCHARTHRNVLVAEHQLVYPPLGCTCFCRSATVCRSWRRGSSRTRAGPSCCPSSSNACSRVGSCCLGVGLGVGLALLSLISVDCMPRAGQLPAALHCAMRTVGWVLVALPGASCLRALLSRG